MICRFFYTLVFSKLLLFQDQFGIEGIVDHNIELISEGIVGSNHFFDSGLHIQSIIKIALHLERKGLEHLLSAFYLGFVEINWVSRRFQNFLLFDQIFDHKAQIFPVRHRVQGIKTGFQTVEFGPFLNQVPRLRIDGRFFGPIGGFDFKKRNIG